MAPFLIFFAALAQPLPPQATNGWHRPPAAHAGALPGKRYSLTIALDPPAPGPPRPRIVGTAGRPLVVIDPGHGGHDPGAVASEQALREKDVTLAVARAVRDELVRGGRARVALTRDDDRFLVLEERTEIARALKADLFISIHADAATVPGATGVTLYTLSEVASDRAAAALAARENRADVIAGVRLGRQSSDVSSILVDLAQRGTIAESSRFVSLVRREAGDALPFRTNYHRMAGFAVLKAPDVPAVLLEIGYITNADDAKRIASSEGRRAIAQAIRRATDVYFARRLTVR